MTTKEWANMYPEIAISIFNCSVDELDSILEEKQVSISDHCYITKAELDKYNELIMKNLGQ